MHTIVEKISLATFAQTEGTLVYHLFEKDKDLNWPKEQVQDSLIDSKASDFESLPLSNFLDFVDTNVELFFAQTLLKKNYQESFSEISETLKLKGNDNQKLFSSIASYLDNELKNRFPNVHRYLNEDLPSDLRQNNLGS